jgi:ABC-type transport system involved in resistance to organic solvents, ATPase component
MIDVSNVYKSFGQNHVLKGVNLKVHDGKSMVIMGASGQGKSVILKCLLGLTKPNSGKILLNGVDPNSAQKNIILSKVGMLFQGGALFDSLPVWQNVAFRYLHGKQKINASEARKIAIKKLERVGLEKSFADNFPSQLSGGKEKRVALARDIATQPEIIF